MLFNNLQNKYTPSLFSRLAEAFSPSLLGSLAVVPLLMLLLSGCARMGAPDGGWFDERPPYVVSASPADGAVNVKNGKINIYFNEFIKVANAAEKVVVSPPQMEQPNIRVHGKTIQVQLMDSLKENTTYTVDFSDAISDNNEGNPMGNYTYTFSTGPQIDTLQISGTVLNAENLEPIKGIVVGVRPAPKATPEAASVPEAASETAPVPEASASGPLLRVSRTDSKGRFTIKGIAPGDYTVMAVNDMDGDYTFTQRSETMAFSHEIVTPTVFVDTRQDTVWADALHVKDIVRVRYDHYTPDNIVLRAFDHEVKDRYFIKHDRTEENHFTLYFTAPVPEDTIQKLPKIRLLNPPAQLAHKTSDELFLVRPTVKADTVTYWIRDSILIDQDTLNIEMQTIVTDTLGGFTMQTDTLEVLPKLSFEKRMKQKQKALDEWRKKQEKSLKKRRNSSDSDNAPLPIDTVMPREPLMPKYVLEQNMSPDASIYIKFPRPMQKVDTTAIHLYVEQDSLWYKAPCTITPYNPQGVSDDALEISSDWIMGAQYSFEVDSAAFVDIYGNTSQKVKQGMRINLNDVYASLFVEVTPTSILRSDSLGTHGQIIVELLDGSDKSQVSAIVENGTAEFYYLKPGVYYMRAIIDRNGNGRWDAGDYFQDRLPEEVYYYPGTVECKAKWDLTKKWNLLQTPLNQQKPEAITKQKAEKDKQIQNRNAQRAAEKGTTIPARFMPKQ